MRTGSGCTPRRSTRCRTLRAGRSAAGTIRALRRRLHRGDRGRRLRRAAARHPRGVERADRCRPVVERRARGRDAARPARTAEPAVRRRAHRAARAAGRDRARGSALRNHGPDGVEPGGHDRARCSSTRARWRAGWCRCRRDAEVLVLDSGVARELAGSGYNTRRAECEEAARLLGVAALRDVGIDELARVEALPEPLRRRARHVVTENQRVLDAVHGVDAARLRRADERVAREPARRLTRCR